MSIYVEARATELNLPSAVRVENLESWTGADVIVSRLTVPMKTFPLLMRHVDEGALLLQIKRGEDLASSVGDRLTESIARMRVVTRRIPQHWLVFIGTLSCDREGSALINGYRTHRNVSFATVDGAICNWMARGGLFYALNREELLENWLGTMERRLSEYHAHATKYAMSSPDFPDDLPGIHDDPLQLPVAVKDARRVLVGFRNLGPETVNKVWAFCGGFKESLAFLTDPRSAGKLEGIGAKTIASIRRQCGLTDADSYIGWGHDAVDVDAIVQGIGKSIEQALPNQPVSAEQRAKDMDDIFGKQKARAK